MFSLFLFLSAVVLFISGTDIDKLHNYTDGSDLMK